jgi:hypothetical protein
MLGMWDGFACVRVDDEGADFKNLGDDLSW